MILDKRHGYHMESIDKCLEGELFTFQPFFENNPAVDLHQVINGARKDSPALP